MDEYKINLRRYFFQEEDGLENPTLVYIKNINGPTVFSFPKRIDDFIPRDILFQHESKQVLRERLRRLLNAVSNNCNIYKLVLNGHYLHIPGSLLAAWIDSNPFVSKFDLVLEENQSDMQLICNALQRDTTIKTISIGFDDSDMKEQDFILLGEALRKNRGIITLVFYVDNYGESLRALSHAVGPGSNIKCLIITRLHHHFNSAISIADELEEILSNNASLTLFKMDCFDGFGGNVLPILRGVANSDIAFFHLTAADGMYGNVEYQKEQIEVIAKMSKLKAFSYKLQNFSNLPAGLISSSLERMSSLEMLEVGVRNCKADQVHSIIKDMSTWKKKCNLKISCTSPKIEMVSLLKYVQLESFHCCFCDNHIFDKIIEAIPNCNFLKELIIQLKPEFSNLDSVKHYKGREIQFAAAVSRNSSLEKIIVKTSDYKNFLSVEVQKTIIDYLMARNQLLAKCKQSPQKVPFQHWPELLSMANPTGLDFSYTCIRKIPDLFLSFVHSGKDKNNLPSSSANHCLHRKRDASTSEQHATGKRSRNIPPL